MTYDLNAIRRTLKQLQIKKPDMVEPLIPIDEWIRDPYYVGKDGIFNEEEKIGLYPYFRDLLCDIFEYEGKYDVVVVGGGIGVGKSCIIKTQKIPTTLGLLSLEELHEAFHKQGKRFEVLSESGLRPCLDVYDNGIDDTKIINTKEGRSVQCTFTHKFRVVRKGQIVWVKSSDLIKGDVLLITQEQHPFGQKHIDADEAYMLGYVLGSGKLLQSEKTKKYRGLCAEVNSGFNVVRSRLSKAFNDVFKSTKVKKADIKSKEHYLAYAGIDEAYVNALIEEGFDADIETRDIPKRIYACDKGTVSIFLRGFFDACARIDQDGSVRILIRSERLRDNLAAILAMFGIACTYTYQAIKYYGKFYGLNIVNEASRRNFAEFINFDHAGKRSYFEERLYGFRAKVALEDATFNVPYVVDELKRLDLLEPLNLPSKSSLGTWKNARAKNFSYRQLRKLYEAHPLWCEKSDYIKFLCTHAVSFDKVESIESGGEAHTMDLSIDTDHSYCFNGFISHNTFGYYCMARKLYELSVYECPQSRFKLQSHAPIGLLYFCAASKFMAIRLGKQLRETFDCIPYFNEKFPRNTNVDSELRFPKNISFYFGTGEGDMIGISMVASILDEANFKGDARGDSNSDLSAIQKLHNSILTRQASRFSIGGTNYGMNIIISSATTSNSYTEKLFAEAATNPRIKAVNLRTWDVKPWKHHKERFYVFRGSEKYDPFVMDSHSKIESRLNIKVDRKGPLSDIVNNLPLDLKRLVDAVPTDLEALYHRDIYQALRDFSGVSVYAQGKLFQDKHVFNECIDTSLPRIFSRNEFTVETNNNSPTNCIQYYLDAPFLDPEKPRYIHIDLGLTNDATGIACCYKAGETVADGIRSPVFIYDFSLRLVPPPLPRRISIARVNEFILYLSKKLRLAMVSMDQFQSSASLQFFEENGIPCRYQSVDRSDKAYLFFVDCMYRNVVRFPKDFAEAIGPELFNLNWNRAKHKVDHPGTTQTGGMKDRMDAVVGALYNAFECSPAEYNPADLLMLSEHNPETQLTYVGDLKHQSARGIYEREPIIGSAGGFYTQDEISETDLLTMPLYQQDKENEACVYKSKTDWDSLVSKHTRDE